MKGTLFSADFVKDGEGNLRLLELNTDTAFTSGALAHTNFDSFINIISSSNISQVDVIYKERIHSNFVEQLSQSLASSNISPSLNLHVEEPNTIYPTVITDAADKFILRCAYDESAIFDSEYCKQGDQLLRLFYDNNDTGSIPTLYHSSSNFFVDNLQNNINTDNIPDFVEKGTVFSSSGLKFYKTVGTGSISQKVSSLKDRCSDTSYLINFYNNPSDTVAKSYRSFNLVYGPSLDVINFCSVEVEALLDKPSDLVYNLDSGLVDDKHYYEFATNYPRATEVGGVFQEEEIVDSSGNPVKVKDTVIGNAYKSNFISGSPDTDSIEVFSAWSYPGHILPSGSYTTSSILTNKQPYDLPRKLISHIVTSNSSSFYLSPNQHLLIYDSSEDLLRYKDVSTVNVSTDKLIKSDGTTMDILSNTFEVLEDDNLQIYVLDLEPNDTFVLYDSDINLKIVTHNACFPAGTRIKLEDGTYKLIENIKKGDSLLSYDTSNKIFKSGRVSSIKSSEQDSLVYIKTNSGIILKCTPGHKIYCNGFWREAKDIRIGDILVDSSGREDYVSDISEESKKVEVYHIMNVGSYHTYFANDILVHNYSAFLSCFIAGTEILLSDGNSKPIEEISVGDKILSFNEKSGLQESDVVYEILSPIHNDLVKFTLENGQEITSTFDHPYYVNGLDLASYHPHKTNSLYNLEKQVNQIKVGDRVNLADGSSVGIASISILPEVDTVTFLLRVNNNQNFYANRILVHNK